MNANGPAVSGCFCCRVDWRTSAGLYVFVTMPIRPKGARHGAVFALMVHFFADYECRGTNLIAKVICPGIEVGSKPTSAVSRYKLNRTK